MRLRPTFSDCAESALLVDFGPQYDRQLSLSILQVSKALEAAMLQGLKESVPALTSLTVLYDPFELSKERIVSEIQHLCEVAGAAPACARTWEIPTVYGGDRGPDLEEVARRAGITQEEATALHAGPDYHVYMLGFLPGFAYLGDLPKKAGDAAPGHAARFSASGIGGDRRGANRDIPARESWRLACHRLHARDPLGFETAKGASLPSRRPGLLQTRGSGGGKGNPAADGRGLEPSVQGSLVTASLQVIDAGVAATLQDGGREGYQRFGVPVSGALDKVSLAIANALAGNAPHEAAIEVLAAGLSLLVCAESITLAAAGTAGPFVLESAQAAVRIPPFRSMTARRGDIVRLPPAKGGAVFYVAVAGGFDVPCVFGSRSTYRRAALGGFNGRALQAGDELPLRFPTAPARETYALDVTLSAPDVLRVMRGPNAEYFKPHAFETLLTTAYTIAPASDRMGLRLQGAFLERAIQGELPSQGTTAGGLQAPSDGQPILLLADRQTTGGYPRIATVISADLAAAGRLSAGMSIRFQEVSRDEAVRLLKAQREWLASLPSPLKPVAEAFSTEQLLSSNLIGGVIAGSLEEG